MFSLAYLFAALLAAVPLGFTLLQAQAGKAISLHQIYGDLLRIAAVILGIFASELLVRRTRTAIPLLADPRLARRDLRRGSCFSGRVCRCQFERAVAWVARSA